MNRKSKNAIFGRYPCCDLLNNALRSLLKGKNDDAFCEIVYAIRKANGYFHMDIAEKIEEKMTGRRIEIIRKED